jgi:hypothetical protein
MDTPKRRRRNKYKGQKLTEQQKAARRRAREAKFKAAKMRTPLELSRALGIGINQCYAALKNNEIKGAIRLGKQQRWLIPEAVIQRLINGEPLAAA